MSRRRAFVVIAVVALLAFSKPLLRGEVPTLRDHFDYFQPLRWFTAEELRHGRLPLWNAYSASGEPWLANPQTAVFYPPAWLFVALPFATAYTLFLALHVMLAGWGALLLFNRFASQGAALAAALALMFCGPTTSLLDINDNLATFAWIPLVLWCALAKIRPQWSALAIAVSFLAGEPFFAAVGALAFALIRRRDAINVALTSIGFSAIQLFPFLEYVRDSDRAAGIPRNQLLRDSMPLRDWLGLLSPVDLDATQHFIPVVYMGLVTVVLALLAFVPHVGRASARHDGLEPVLHWACAAVILLCILIAAGAFFAPTAALLTNLPVAIFRYPARVVPLAALAICALAAMGIDRAVRPRWIVAVAAVMCADVLLRTLPLLASAPFDAHPVPYDRAVGRDAKLIRIGFEQAKDVDRRAWIAGYLNLYDRRFDAWTAAPLASAAYTRAYQAAAHPPRTDLINAMSCGYVLSARGGKVMAQRNPRALPMTYLRAADGRMAPATWLAFTSSAMYVGVDAPFDATLVVTQQFAPGWRAAIDGDDSETFRDGVFRAVRVTRGHHEVAWRYRPLSLIVGVCVTLLTLLRLLLSIVFVKSARAKFFFLRHSNLRGIFDW
ncbi:MAG: hypothetical protein AABO58_02660 [Acidobacteriota bacterium]